MTYTKGEWPIGRENSVTENRPSPIRHIGSIAVPESAGKMFTAARHRVRLIFTPSPFPGDKRCRVPWDTVFGRRSVCRQSALRRSKPVPTIRFSISQVVAQSANRLGIRCQVSHT